MKSVFGWLTLVRNRGDAELNEVKSWFSLTGIDGCIADELKVNYLNDLKNQTS